MGYCTRLQAQRTGLPPEAFARPPRATERIFPSSGRFALRSHGLDVDFLIELGVSSSSTLGAPAGALPGGLVEGTAYYARPVDSNLFQVATAPSPASAVATFADAGAGVISIIVDHGVYLDDAIEMATTIIDQYARAHAAPIAADVLPFVCSYLAARIYVATHRALVPGVPEAQPPDWIRSLVDKLFQVWLEGAPILQAVDVTPARAENGAVAIRTRPGPFGPPVGIGFGRGPFGEGGSRLGDRRFRV